MKKREFIRLTQNIEFYSLPEFSYYVHHNVKDAPICTSEGRNIKEHESYSTAVNIYSCDDGIEWNAESKSLSNSMVSRIQMISLT